MTAISDASSNSLQIFSTVREIPLNSAPVPPHDENGKAVLVYGDPVRISVPLSGGEECYNSELNTFVYSVY